MATDRLTFVAELKDRLTGPAKKAAKAVEDLGKAAEESAKRTEKANTRVERSEQKRARATKATNELAAASARRRAAVEAESARRVVEAQGRRARAAEAEKQKTVEVVDVVEKSEGRRRRTTDATARDEKRKHGELINRLGEQGDAWAAWRQRNKAAAEGTQKSHRKAADAFDQLAGRTTTGLKSMSKTMDRVDPGRMASRYDTAMNRMLGRTRSTATKMQSALEGVTSASGVQGATMGAAAVGGLSLAGGVKRINDVQQANVVMETMGLSEGDRAKMMGQFKGLAQDTPFSTGSVAALGSGLISSGMDQSQVEAAMQGAIDTAATFGMSLEEMALPLKQIQAKGMLQGDDLMQLMDRNIPMMDWIAKQKGVDKSEVKDLVSKGQVSSEDVFAALAANSEGGAEKASKTLKGSWTNFLSSMSQAGEAFLTPMVEPLTELFQHGKETLTALQPLFKVLGMIGGVLVDVLTPALPVLIPLLIAAGGALLGLMVAAKVAGAVKTLAVAAEFLGARFGRRGGGGATGAVGLFTEFLGGMRDGAKDAYSQRGLGGLNASLDTSTRKMDRAKASAKGLTGKLSGLRGAAAMGGAVLGGMALGATSEINADSDPAGAANSVKMGGDVNAEFKNKEWANHNGSILGGTMSGVDGIGDVVNKKQNMGVGDKITGWFADGKFFGYKDGWQKGFDSLAEQDGALAGMVGTPEAGNRWNTILGDVKRAGSSDQDALASFPQYKAAVTQKLTDKGIQADDNTLLQYMGNTTGYRGGGYTGDGAVGAPAGVVHGREYVFDAATTARIGVDNLRAMHHGAQVSNSTATHFSPTINITAGAGANGAEIRAHVDQALREAERRQRNTHGTRSKVGAR
ncbi:tape measure protein [Kocuria rhizophila]|uniref:tape measure protein n=1 Tax=Kocuria rhizophila TaxID=72000 RepID=UPI0021A3F159|nr:tape measure protein [Kocuria rhizophila]